LPAFYQRRRLLRERAPDDGAWRRRCRPVRPVLRARTGRAGDAPRGARRDVSAVDRGSAIGDQGLVSYRRPMYIADSRRLTSAGAKKMMEAAIAAAAQAGAAVTIAIVDAGGHLVLLERMEGGKFHTVHSATTKAACAASTRRATTSHGAVGQALDTAHALGLALAAGPERWTAMEGGCPILVGGECIGGVGVAGADWKTDETLAQEAVKAIGATWT